jgi:hypothetical protein
MNAFTTAVADPPATGASLLRDAESGVQHTCGVAELGKVAARRREQVVEEARRVSASLAAASRA